MAAVVTTFRLALPYLALAAVESKDTAELPLALQPLMEVSKLPLLASWTVVEVLVLNRVEPEEFCTWKAVVELCKLREILSSAATLKPLTLKLPTSSSDRRAFSLPKFRVSK